MWKPGMDARSILGRAAAARPAGAAVLCVGVTHTYPEIRRLADDLGSAFARAGARPGGRVAAFLPNCHVYLAAYFAALERELVLVPINTRLAAREIDTVLRHSGAVAVVATPGGLASVTAHDAVATGPGWEVAPAPHPDDEPAPTGASHIYYTSGTTGRPKGVVLTRDNLAAHVALTLEELAFVERDVWLHAAPMFHLADAWAVWTATAVGATHVMLPRWDPAAVRR
jgi:acyl-CoA synthetase (AMP-forming)/AMP-acid ligase II